jgi:hypothetical protein
MPVRSPPSTEQKRQGLLAQNLLLAICARAPAGWTNLIDHLRQHGVSDNEMIITGVATMASTGRPLIASATR